MMPKKSLDLTNIQNIAIWAPSLVGAALLLCLKKEINCYFMGDGEEEEKGRVVVQSNME